ncbi:hypothetical protein C1X10_27505, partial [Escherichia coli]|uniref:hypothetical protein n=1 Tax=Escherichia coli TaxID=562 RepID=UPI000CB43CC3
VTPGAPGTLAQGGTLQMARVKGMPNANLAAVSVDQQYELEWVTIANPDQARGERNAKSPRREAQALSCPAGGHEDLWICYGPLACST